MIRSTHANSLARSVTLVLCTSFVAACAETPTGTRLSARDATPLLEVSGEAIQPTWYPNSVKYRDQGLKPATGRSGSATLTARALVDKAGRTELEVTTGKLDAGIAPPGKLEKVQVKAFDPNGVQMSTTNHKPLGGGYASEMLAGLVRGSRLQVQANVSGIDGNRTDVVTVTEMVKRRPDLTIRDVTMPERAVIGVPAMITVVIQELNGDVGARADCAIRVNGVLWAAGHGIWVDAGDAVTCVFGLRFAQPGRHQVEISASRVVPGDYDASNNTEVREIHVDETVTGFQYFAGARDVVESRSVRELFTSFYGPDANGLSQTFSSAREFELRVVRQDAQMSGMLDREAPFPVAAFSFFHATGGRELVRMTYDLDVTQVIENEFVRMRCGQRFDLVPANLGIFISNVCSGVQKVGNAELPFTTFFHNRFTTEAIYQAGTETVRQTVAIPGQPRRDTTWTRAFLIDRPRSQPKYGKDYTVGVKFIAQYPTGAVAYSQSALIPMQPVTMPLGDVPYACSDWVQPPFLRGQHCFEFKNWFATGVEGFVNGVGTAQPLGRVSEVALSP